jgi:hypothetical protein
MIGGAALATLAAVAVGVFFAINQDGSTTPQKVSAQGLTGVTIGATREEVIKAAGQPKEVLTSEISSDGGVETETYLVYQQGTVVLTANDQVDRILGAGAKPGDGQTTTEPAPSGSRTADIEKLQRYAERSTVGRSVAIDGDYSEAARIRSSLVRDLARFQARDDLDPDVAGAASVFEEAMRASLRENRYCASNGMAACDSVDKTEVNALKLELSDKLSRLFREIGAPSYSRNEI